MGRSVAFRDMETKQSRDLGVATWTHCHGCWKIRRQQTRSRKTLEQEVAKTYQLYRIHQRTCQCNIDQCQQAADYIAECIFITRDTVTNTSKKYTTQLRSSQNPRKNANGGSRFQRWSCSRYWNWTLQCWNAYFQRIKQERWLVEAVGDVTENLVATQQDEQKDIWETSYIQDTWKVQRISWTTSRWTEYTWEAVKRQKQMTWYTWKVITGALWRILWFQHPKRKTPNTDSRKVLSPPAFVPSLRVVSSRDQGLRFDTWKMWGTHVFFGHPRAVIGSSQTFRQGILHTLNQSATGGKPPCETVPGDLLSKSEERS